MINYGESRDYIKKVRTKSGIIEEKSNETEDAEVIKLKEIIERLDKEVKNKSTKVNSKAVSRFEILGKNVDNNANRSSFLRRATSRGKEEKYDREFLLNIMKDEHIPANNLHLLTDNDSNLLSEEKDKYKKLANLMIEDPDIIVEKCFIREKKDKKEKKEKRDKKEEIGIYLFNCFSSRSKDVFLDENHFEQEKNRLLLNKLNDINFPKLEIRDSDNSNNNEAKNNNTQNTSQNSKNKYFRKKNEKIFYIPALIKIETAKDNIPSEIRRKKPTIKERSASVRMIKGKNRRRIEETKNKENNKENNKEKKKENTDEEEKKTQQFVPRRSAINSFALNEKNNNRNFWDPEIDGDILCFINHNIISIEDIYHKNINNENFEEKEIKPIDAKEIFTDENSDELFQLINTCRSKNSEENESSTEKSKHNHIHNKFSEFNDYCPKNANIIYRKDKATNEKLQFNDEIGRAHV